MYSGQTTALRDTPAAAPSRPSAVDNLASTLAGTLPAGAQVVVYWIDSHGREGSAECNATHELKVHAQRLLAGAQPDTGRLEIHEAWISDNQTRIAIAAALAEPLPAEVLHAWRLLARRLATVTLSCLDAQARIVSLEKSERLQQALYEISDLAGAGLEMPIMLRRLHAVVGGLMYAENFYIVGYN